jgi:HNH endonuclease
MQAGIAMISCVDCGERVDGGRRRRCTACCTVRHYRRTVRALTPGEPIPPHRPCRYCSSHGYVALRWRVAVRTYVHTYEHRIVDGRITTADHVHHINGTKSDNRPENLRPLSAGAHRAAHARELDWWQTARTLYRSGLSAAQVADRVDRHPATVWRALVKLGEPTRSEDRIAIPHRERNPKCVTA